MPPRFAGKVPKWAAEGGGIVELSMTRDCANIQYRDTLLKARGLTLPGHAHGGVTCTGVVALSPIHTGLVGRTGR